MTARDPAYCGHGRARAIQEVEALSNDEFSRPCCENVARDLGFQLGELEGFLAQLDFMLTGTACYGLTWPQRFERVRNLQELARQGAASAASGWQRG